MHEFVYVYVLICRQTHVNLYVCMGGWMLAALHECMYVHACIYIPTEYNSWKYIFLTKDTQVIVHRKEEIWAAK